MQFFGQDSPLNHRSDRCPAPFRRANPRPTMPLLSLPHLGRLRLLSLRRVLLHHSPDCHYQNGPLRLRVYRGGCSFGTRWGCPQPDSPGSDALCLACLPPRWQGGKRLRPVAGHLRRMHGLVNRPLASHAAPTTMQPSQKPRLPPPAPAKPPARPASCRQKAPKGRCQSYDGPNWSM